MRIIFYSNRITINHDGIKSGSLGGSEMALLNLSSALKSEYPEHEIILYTPSTNPGTHDGIVYKDISEFWGDCKSFKADVFISLRDNEPFGLPYIDAKEKIFWSEDYMNEPKIQALRDNVYQRKNTDHILAISDFAKEDIQKAFPEKKIYLQRNGYNADLIGDLADTRFRDPIAVYTSTPFRGLDVLAELWSPIYYECKNRGVEPELKVFGGMALYQQSDDVFKQLYEHLTRQPGVKVYGSISQVDLYSEVKKAKVMLYPNHYTESGCMAILEAIACGVWCVTTDLGALGEQVIDNKNGFLIRGDAHSKIYKDLFVSKAVHSLISQLLPMTDHQVVFTWKEQAGNLMKILNEVVLR